MNRGTLLTELAAQLISVVRSHPVRVAVDGVDAAGKTTLADELVAPLASYGREVIRASIDGFHRPRGMRYRRGPGSPEGYYHDSFDYAALRTALLEPLGPGGNRRYRTAVYDVRADTPVIEPLRTAAPDAIVIVDGIFLLRPELRDLWDYRIFVDVEFAVSVERAVARDVHLGTAGAARARYLERYVPGQRLYLDSVHPREQADAVVVNHDPANPELFIRA